MSRSSALHHCSAARWMPCTDRHPTAGHSSPADLREGTDDEATQPGGTGSTTADAGPARHLVTRSHWYSRHQLCVAPPDVPARPLGQQPPIRGRQGHAPGHCDHGTRGPEVRCFGCCAAPPPGPSMEHRLPVAVLHQCSVAVDRGSTGRHSTARRLVADLRKRHELAQAEPGRYDRVRALNPRVRGSSPWRRTRSRTLTCTYAIGKILCRSHVDVPVLERCSLAESGAA